MTGISSQRERHNVTQKLITKPYYLVLIYKSRNLESCLLISKLISLF